METKEYRTIDKTGWRRGEWSEEPDKRQWPDQETGLPCLIVRGPSGALCGYVGVGPEHPFYGLSYSDRAPLLRPTLVQLLKEREVLDLYESDLDSEGGVAIESVLDAHGGLTYSAGCGHADDERTGVCHVPGDGEADSTWWFGFDCAHAGDFAPAFDSLLPAGLADRLGAPTGWGGVIEYRNVNYVKAQCRGLATALAKIGKDA